MKTLTARLRSFFHMSSKIRQAYWEDTLVKNRRSLLVIAILAIVIEAYNVIRVLFLTSAKLGTLNNRIYFSFYCSLLVYSVLYLILARRLRRASYRVQWALQYVTTLVMLLWHVCINLYDLRRDPNGETTIFITAVLALAVFIHMPARYSLLLYALAWGLFFPLAGPSLTAGDRINLTITVVVALAVSLTVYHNTAIFLNQQHQINRASRRLQAMLELEPLTGLLNTSALQKRAEALLATGAPVTLIIVDMDDFKGINDHFGHPCGDYVLREVALALQAAFPYAHGIGRIGGDEFAVVAEEASREELQRKARQLLARLSQIRWADQPVGACCTLGVCQGQGVLTYEELYRQADQVLYQAKEAGKGRCFIGELVRPAG